MPMSEFWVNFVLFLENSVSQSGSNKANSLENLTGKREEQLQIRRRPLDNQL